MKRFVSSLWLALALGVVATGCGQTTPTTPADQVSLDRGRGDDDRNDRDDDDDDDKAVTYAVIGDVPYTDSRLNGGPSFPTLIAAINQDADVKRVVHIGDIKAGSATCDDGYFTDIAAKFATFADPLVYTPGDNEWTDCHRANNGGYNPLERLAKVRELFFPNPGWTLGGKPKHVHAQKGYPENVRWGAADVVFATLHVIGSNNGRAPWFGDRAAPNKGETAAETASREAEYLGRNAANIGWLEKTFREAREDNAKGIVLFLQADMWHPEDRALGASFTAHQEFVARLSELATKFRRPVLIISGDIHEYRVDAGVPWFTQYYNVPSPANVTQVIVDRSIEINRTGAADPSPINYLKLTIDPKSPEVFSWIQVNVAP